MHSPHTATPVSSGTAVASPQKHLILGTRQNAECWGHGPSVEEADSHELLSAPICQATRILVSLSPNLANSLHLALGIRFPRALLYSPCLKDQKSKDGSPAHPSQASPWAEPPHGARDAHSSGFLSPLICPSLPISLSADRGPDPLFGS